jgi:hypothetical protein
MIDTSSRPQQQERKKDDRYIEMPTRPTPSAFSDIVIAVVTKPYMSRRLDSVSPMCDGKSGK